MLFDEIIDMLRTHCWFPCPGETARACRCNSFIIKKTGRVKATWQMGQRSSNWATKKCPHVSLRWLWDLKSYFWKSWGVSVCTFAHIIKILCDWNYITRNKLYFYVLILLITTEGKNWDGSSNLSDLMLVLVKWLICKILFFWPREKTKIKALQSSSTNIIQRWLVIKRSHLEYVFRLSYI